MVHQLFEEQAARTPEAVAVIYEEEELSYRELNRRANQLANYLIKRGVEPEVMVGICIERSLEMVIGLLGILKAGGVYVPLDPSYPSARLTFMLRNAGIRLLVSQTKLVAGLPVEGIEVVCLDRDWDAVSEASEENPESNVGAENLAYVIYTSGSTGAPKGVLGLHRGAINRCDWMWDVYPCHPPATKREKAL